MVKDLDRAIELVREGLQREGGDIEVVAFEAGVVFVKLKGRCSSCALSGMTMKNWVEKVIKDMVPEIKEVREV